MQERALAPPSKSSPGKGVSAEGGAASPLKQSLRGKSFDQGAAALAPPPESGPLGAAPGPAASPPGRLSNLKGAAPGTRDVDAGMFGQGVEMKYDPNWQLIIGGIKPADVVQGKIGDCYLMAALAAVAQTNPGIIQSMVQVIPGAKGAIPTFSVRFFRPSGGGFAPEWVRVSGALPLDVAAGKQGGYNFAAHGHTAGPTVSREIWPAIVEKAYTLFKANTKDPGKASYKGIEGGDGGVAMSHITGAASKAVDLNGPGSQLIGVFDQMLQASKNGQPMTASSYPPEVAPAWNNLWGVWAEKGMKYGKEAGNESRARMANTHAYAVTAVRMTPSRQVQIRNPWGELSDWLAWPKFCELFRAVKINGKERRAQ